MFYSDVEIRQTTEKGRGVFACVNLPEGKLVEVAPVLVLSAEERVHVEKTSLYNYIFEWGDDVKQCCVGFGYTSMYNHASPSNCDYDMDFDNQTISILTMKDIAAGEELTINYSDDWNGTKPVWWFHAK
jgi:SET domain-containing protein